MTDMGTSRLYRANPAKIGQPECWGQARAHAFLELNSIVVTVAGEIDAHNASHLANFIERHSALDGRLYLDLREVTFFASAGLAVLRRVEHQLNLRGADWRLLPSPAVRKLLRIAGADDLPQIDTLGPASRTASAALVDTG